MLTAPATATAAGSGPSSNDESRIHDHTFTALPGDVEQ
jgi:hypothetical protein